MLSSLRLGFRTLVVFAAAGLGVQAAEKLPTGWEHSLNHTAGTIGYTKKYGTAQNDSLTGITTDALGNVLIAGNSVGSQTSGFLRKYSSLGAILWEKTKPATSIDGATLDKNGNAYVVGSDVTGTWPSIRHRVYLEKYDSAGNIQWTKFVLAAPASDPTLMVANGVATDPRGNNTIVILFERAFWPYQTRQVLIRKYNVSGVPVWEKPVGSSSPYTARPTLTTARNGNISTAINTASFQRWNMTISQFDPAGDPLWSTTFYPEASSLETYIHAIAADPAGNVCVAGITKAGLAGANLGYYDAFVRKLDISGKTLWTRQFGTIANDYANSLTTDAAGNVYVAGSSSGMLAATNRGNFDAVVRKYGSSGNVLQTWQFGSPEFDIANGVRVDAHGSLYAAGHTYGNLGGAKQGGQDVFFRKFNQPAHRGQTGD